MKGLIQQGTFLIFDELHAFAGDTNKGEARALNEFIEMTPPLSLREFCNYGAGGKVFIVDLGSGNGTYVNNKKISKWMPLTSEF